MAVRSATFVSQGIDSDKINEDIGALRTLPSERRRALAGFLSAGQNLSLKKEVLGSELQAFLREHDISGEVYDRACRLLLFISQSHEQRSDTPEVILQDLSEVVPLGTRGSATEFSVFDFIEATLPAIHRRNQDILCHTAVARGMPQLSAVTYSCDVRMVAEKHFHPLTDKASEYQPNAFAWIPVAILNLTTDEDTEFYCQFDLKGLEKVIDNLQAIRKDLVYAEEALSRAGLPAQNLKRPEQTSQGQQ